MSLCRNPLKAWNLETIRFFPSRLIILLVSQPLTALHWAPHLHTRGSLGRTSSLFQAQTSATCLHCSPNSHFPVGPPHSYELPKTHTWLRPCHLSAFNLAKAHGIFRIKFRHLTLVPEPHPQAPVWLPPCHLFRLDLPLSLPGMWLSGPSDDLPSLGHASGQRTFAGASLCVWRGDIFPSSSELHLRGYPLHEGFASVLSHPELLLSLCVFSDGTRYAHPTVLQWLLSACVLWKHSLQPQCDPTLYVQDYVDSYFAVSSMPQLEKVLKNIQ